MWRIGQRFDVHDDEGDAECTVTKIEGQYYQLTFDDGSEGWWSAYQVDECVASGTLAPEPDWLDEHIANYTEAACGE